MGDGSIHLHSGQRPRAQRAPSPERLDPRTVRSRQALREALAAEIRSTGDLNRVTVTAVAERAGVTRRTFYSHYRDIPDLVASVEADLVAGVSRRIRAIADARLVQMVGIVTSNEPVPGSVELLEYVRENADVFRALLGKGGDPALQEKIQDTAHQIIAPRALTGIDASAAVGFFDYYITYAISAEMGVLVRWLEEGMRESCEVMARIMTMLTFVRPGDLYGFPVSIDIPAYSTALMQMEEDSHDE